MPSSASSVRGLSREIPFDLLPDESCEHMMRRIDAALTDAVCRHLVGCGDGGGDGGAGGDGAASAHSGRERAR